MADDRPIYVRNRLTCPIEASLCCCEVSGTIFAFVTRFLKEPVMIPPGVRTRLANRVEEPGAGPFSAVVGYLNVRTGGKEVQLSDESFTIRSDDCFMVVRQRFGSVTFLAEVPPGTGLSVGRVSDLDDTDFIFNLNGERVTDLPDEYVFFAGNGLRGNSLLQSIRNGQVHTFYRIDLGIEGGTFEVTG